MTTAVTLIVVVFAVVANGLMLVLDRRAHALSPVGDHKMLLIAKGIGDGGTTAQRTR